MPIVKMKKIFLLAHREERSALIELLHREGSVQLVCVKDSGSWSDLHEWVLPEQVDEAVALLDSKLSEARYCLDFLQRHFPVRKGIVEQFTGGRLSMTADLFARYASGEEKVKEIYAACREAEETLTRLRNEETRCQNLAAELEPWAAFDLPLEEVRDSERVRMTLGTLPSENTDSLRQALAERAPDSMFEVVSRDKESARLFVLYPAAEEAAVLELLRGAAFGAVKFGAVEGTAKQVLADLASRLDRLAGEKAEILAEVEKLLEHRPRLMAYYDWHENQRIKGEAMANLVRTESCVLVQGWIPAPALPRLRETLARQSQTAVLVEQDPDPYEEHPILLENRGPAGSFEVVTRLYSLPRKEEPDPTPLLAPFFFVFFGICLSDAGYGLLLSLVALFLTRKLKLAGMGKQLVQLLFWGGLSALLFGVLMGGYFGDLIELPPLWFNPLDDPMRMLLYCFALGLFQVYFGMAVQAYRNIKAGKLWHAVFDQGLWYLFLTSLVLLAVPGVQDIARLGALGGGVGLILTQGRSQEGLLKKFFGGLLSLYNVTGYLSDVLSYSRLLALGLATGVIASAINTMAGMLAGTLVGAVLMVVLLCGGHIFNLVISTLGSYVHTSRLQYIEFFGKFFDGGGKPFKPLRETNRYVDVEVEKEVPVRTV